MSFISFWSSLSSASLQATPMERRGGRWGGGGEYKMAYHLEEQKLSV